MEYYVCEAKTTAELRDEVNRYIKKGWRPVGGVAVNQSISTSTWWFYQAMVLKTSDPGGRDSWEIA